LPETAEELCEVGHQLGADDKAIVIGHVQAPFRVEFRSDERLREMSRKERSECQPGRGCQYWQHRSNSHRHDDRLAAFLDVYDRRPLRAPHREDQRFVEAVAQFALERNGIP
jgi:hypothetical protein